MRDSLPAVATQFQRIVIVASVLGGVIALGALFLAWQTRDVGPADEVAHGEGATFVAATQLSVTLPDISADPVPKASAFGGVLTPERAATLSLDEIEALVEKDPASALLGVDAKTAKDDAEAQRLAVVEVKSLVGIGQMGRARARAAAYYDRWPKGAATDELVRITGQHPTNAP